jgi:CheY-like chemotaxis protein
MRSDSFLLSSDPSQAGESLAGAIAARAHMPIMLLIDDEPMVSRFIGHAAEDCGYRAVATSCAESFRRAYRAHAPDVVTVDLGVPGCDGIEILRFLAEEKCPAPVIIISGFDRRILESSMRLGQALGLKMIGPLEKPVRFLDLARLLDNIETEAAG